MFTFNLKGDIMAKKKVEVVDGVETGKKDNTCVLPCNCEHAYQDAKYGKNKRVYNRALTKSGSGSSWRCTVCGNLKS